MTALLSPNVRGWSASLCTLSEWNRTARPFPSGALHGHHSRAVRPPVAAGGRVFSHCFVFRYTGTPVCRSAVGGFWVVPSLGVLGGAPPSAYVHPCVGEHIRISLGMYVPRSGIAEWKGMCGFSFCTYYHTVFQSEAPRSGILTLFHSLWTLGLQNWLPLPIPGSEREI